MALKRGFFSEDRPRELYATKTWADKGKNWQELTDQERTEACKVRAESHNSNLRSNHIATFRENACLLQEFTNFCSDREINLVIAIPPVTKAYLSILNPQFKECFYETLEDLDGVVHLLDMSDDPYFDDVADMNDMDHLGDVGARKFTKIVMQLIQSL